MAFLTAVTLTGLFLAVAYYIFTIQRYERLARSHGCQPPRKYPHKDPIFGLDLLLPLRKLVRENRLLSTSTQRFMDYGPTFEINRLGTTMICSCDPENLQSVFGTNAKDWGVGHRLAAMQPWAGRGFMTTDGAEHQHYRNLIASSMTKADVSDHYDYERHLTLMLKLIPRDGSTVDLQELISKLYLDTSTSFLLGEPFGALSGDRAGDAQEFIRASERSFGGAGVRIRLGWLRFLYRDPKWDEANRTNHRIIDKYVDDALARQKRALGEQNGDEKSTKQRTVLVDKMVGQTNDRIEVRNGLIQAFAVSHDTTACLISNVFWLLARHPAVWERLRDEVHSLGDTPLDFELPMKLPYLRNVINETLRLYSILPFSSRTALTNTILPTGGGPSGTSPIFVRAGTDFTAGFFPLHRSPRIWGPDADAFDPDRWDTFKPSTWQFLPFGGGPRACVGRQKALLEAAYFTVRMLREFGGIEARGGGGEWVGKVAVTAKSADGCKVALTPA